MNLRSEEFKTIFKNNKLISSSFIKYLNDNAFFDQVASSKFHGVYEGGLYDHSKNVMNALLEFTKNEKLVWQREESPYIIGMFHDLCKIDNYIKCDDGSYKVNYDKRNLGHGERSVMLLNEFIKLTEEEVYCITYHMGAYEVDKWSDFDKAIKKYPNVLWTHMADMVASKIIEEKVDEK